MPRGKGNGQGNFTSYGRNTKPMREVMLREKEAEKRKKKEKILKNFLAYRESKMGMGRA